MPNSTDIATGTERPSFSFLQKTLIAFVAATLVFARQIGLFLEEENRFYIMWGTRETLAVFADIGLLAIAGLALSCTLRALNWMWASRLYNHAFLLILASSVISLVPPARLRPYPEFTYYYLLWFGVVGVICFSLGNPRSRLVEWGGKACLILSPLVPILAIQMFTRPSWSVSNDPIPPPGVAAREGAAATTMPVLFFVFDEWSFPRTIEGGEYRAELPNLRKLAGKSFDFHNTSSVSAQTKRSLPAIIYQTDQTFQIENGEAYWSDSTRRVAAAEVASIFRSMKQLGYGTLMHGFYLPYPRILGDDLDYCRTWPFYPQGGPFVETMFLAAARNTQYLADPLTQGKRGNLQARLESRWWFEQNHQYRDQAIALIEKSPDSLFCFFHWPLPHGPFVFETDGSYRGSYRGRGGNFPGLHGNPEDYERNLQYQDRILGEVVDRLETCGKFDRALLVMTGDHAWRYDPRDDVTLWKSDPAFRRVPLLIKLPGQSSRHIVQKKVCNNRLLPMLEQIIRENLDEDRVLKLIDDLDETPSPTVGTDRRGAEMAESPRGGKP
jgi:hypothetical protein